MKSKLCKINSQLLHFKSSIMVWRSPQLEFVSGSYTSRKVPCPIDHHDTKGCHIISILTLLTHVQLVTCGVSRRFQRIQNPNFDWGLKHAKTLNLSLDYFQAMLNIGPLGQEGFHSYCIKYCSIRKQSIQNRIMKQNRGSRRFRSNHVSHNVHGNSMLVPFSCICIS